MPLHSFHAMYEALAACGKSVVDACAMDERELKFSRDPLSFERITNELRAIGINESNWRKSSQWAALIRKHVEIFANESYYMDIFGGVYDNVEHYVPVVLEIMGLANETTCSTGLASLLPN